MHDSRDRLHTRLRLAKTCLVGGVLGDWQRNELSRQQNTLEPNPITAIASEICQPEATTQELLVSRATVQLHCFGGLGPRAGVTGRPSAAG